LESRGPSGEVLRTRLSIAPNPSHLEAVKPVVLGMVRAEQARLGSGGRGKVLGLLLHGDAAVAGEAQGLVKGARQALIGFLGLL
jgi:2-oxoglutarate dehydrogenase complex dehydrogenase (E1) component-like enzyme